MKATRLQLALLGLSAVLAIAYGAFGSKLYDGAPPYILGTIFKASSIIILGVIALMARSRLLGAGLLFGALGDALLAWSPDTFMAGSLAFLVGHLFYIALFLRSGIGVAALQQPQRVLLMFVMIVAAITNMSALVPQDSPMLIPLAIYTAVLTLMVITSYTLPRANWIATAGAVLFFVSDGFVALNMFHRNPDPTAAFWLSFAGWMIYWAGQAAICWGALGLHKTQRG